MPPTETITAFTAFIVAIWAIIMARSPREWRHWWCARLGVSDLNTSRQQRRWQERRLRYASIAVGLVSLTVALIAGSAVVWSVGQRDFGRQAPKEQKVISIGGGL